MSITLSTGRCGLLTWKKDVVFYTWFRYDYYTVDLITTKVIFSVLILELEE